MGRLGAFVAIAFLGLFLVPQGLEASAALGGAVVAGAPGARASAQLIGGGNEPMVLADRAGQYLWIGALTNLWRSGDQGATWDLLSPPTARAASRTATRSRRTRPADSTSRTRKARTSGS